MSVQEIRRVRWRRGSPRKTTGTVAGVKWTVPVAWTAQPERPMRVATYTIPAAEGDQDPARVRCVVLRIRPGRSGGDEHRPLEGAVRESRKRWRRASTEVNGIPVSTVELAGTYLAPGGPMMQSTGKKENTRLLGAIITAPEGNGVLQGDRTVEDGRRGKEGISRDGEFAEQVADSLALRDRDAPFAVRTGRSYV